MYLNTMVCRLCHVYLSHACMIFSKASGMHLSASFNLLVLWWLMQDWGLWAWWPWKNKMNSWEKIIKWKSKSLTFRGIFYFGSTIINFCKWQKKSLLAYFTHLIKSWIMDLYLRQVVDEDVPKTLMNMLSKYKWQMLNTVTMLGLIMLNTLHNCNIMVR